MPKFEFAAYTRRTFFEIEAETEAEAREKLFAAHWDYQAGNHTDTIDGPESFDLVDGPADDDGEPEAPPLHKFTVIWGDIGDECCTRLDHVTVSDAAFPAIMDAAFECQFSDLEKAGHIFEPGDKHELRHNTPYTGHAIIAGHVTDAPGLGFC